MHPCAKHRRIKMIDYLTSSAFGSLGNFVSNGTRGGIFQPHPFTFSPTSVNGCVPLPVFILLSPLPFPRRKKMDDQLYLFCTFTLTVYLFVRHSVQKEGGHSKLCRQMTFLYCASSSLDVAEQLCSRS